MDSNGTALREALSKRADVFGSLADAPASKPELVDRLASSRSTVDRAIDDLEAVDCVDSRNGTYSLTATGRHALAAHRRYAASTDAVDRASTLLNGLPDGVTLPATFLRGATVTVAGPHAPDGPETSVGNLLERATSMYGLAPAVLKSDVFLLDRETDRGAFEAEVVAEPAVVSALAALSDAPVGSLVDSESFTLCESDGSLPYALWVFETPSGAHAGITFRTGDSGGMITNDDPDAVAWARERYRSYRDRADPVDPSTATESDDPSAATESTDHPV